MGQDAPRPLTRGEHKRMIVFGIPGSGKTRLAGSAKSLIIRPPTDHVDAIPASSPAKEWVVENWDDMDSVHEWIRHNGIKRNAFGWYWLDSISLFQDYGVDEIFEAAITRKPARAEFGPDKGEYGINMNRLAKWVRDMCALPINFGITAHTFEGTDENGDIKLMPWIQGKNMPQKICGYMNIVAYLKAVSVNDKTRRVLFTRETGRYYAKDQYRAFPNGRLIDPTIPKIERAIAEAVGRKPARNTARKPATRRS